MEKSAAFRGRYEHTVDEKGRTALPARFRDALRARHEDRLVVTCGLEPCLVAYPLGEWRAFEKRLSKLPQFDPSVVRLKRMYVSSAIDCPVDRQGRLLLPPTLREHAALSKDVLWAGMLSHIELWSRERWLRIAAIDDDERQRLRQALGELGL